jgi:hypothetical protein
LPEGLSETATKDKEFDQHFWNENKKRKHRFIDEIVAIALYATQIPLSIFTFIPQEVSKAFNVGINA